MLNADRAPYFETCPRCGDGGLQRLTTHSYCVGCNYSDVIDDEPFLVIPQWALDALRADKRRQSHEKYFQTPDTLMSKMPPDTDSHSDNSQGSLGQKRLKKIA